MREFATQLSPEFRKGLRAFKNPEHGKERCIECLNLMPGELGLLPHEVITGPDLSGVTVVPPVADGLRAYWKLDEAAGGPYYDVLGLSHMLRVTNDDDLASVDPGIEGKCVRAAQTQGQQGTAGEGAYAADNAQFTLASDYTINFWLQYSTYPSLSYWLLRKTEVITGSWANPVLREWGFWIQGTSDGVAAIQFLRGNGSSTWSNTIQANITARDGVWHMITARYVASTTTLTLTVSNATDGFEAFSANSNSVAVLSNTSQPVVLSNFQNLSEASKFFFYDEIGIWGTTLGTTTRQALWNSGNGLTFPFV